MALGYLTSSTLIATIQRECLLPETQSTFTESDLLAIANQEVRVSLVPHIISLHEEYFVRDSDPYSLIQNKSNYSIPYRAVGGKFRSVFYQDTSGNLRSMSRIAPEDRSYYQQSNFQDRFVFFYLQGNELVIAPSVGPNPVGSLVFSYYLRPNELVDESRVSTIQGISLNGIPGYTNMYVLGDISNGSNQILNVSSLTGLSINQVINGTGIPTNSIITNITGTTLTLNNLLTQTAVQSPLNIQCTTSFMVDQIPQNVDPIIQKGVSVSSFSMTSVLDILQTNPGHKTLSIDKTPVIINYTNKIITFITTDTDPSTVLGDYVAFAGECIIPQIPADLHDELSQRVVARVLLALGDQAGYQGANDKLNDMKSNTTTLMTNRSEGEPQKINNLSGLLRSSKIRHRGRI